MRLFPQRVIRAVVLIGRDGTRSAYQQHELGAVTNASITIVDARGVERTYRFTGLSDDCAETRGYARLYVEAE
jgi:hypothetical protein